MQVDPFALHVSSRSSKPRRGLPAAGPEQEGLGLIASPPTFSRQNHRRCISISS